MKKQCHLAQINIARMKAPLVGPEMQGFVAGLEPINALADDAPGFVWRLQSDDGDATDFRPFDDDWLLVNLSVWESITALREYTYKTAHVEFVRQRKSWFEKMQRPHQTMWWVPAGYIPSVTEAVQRLEHLQKHGPTPLAFTFQQTFEPEEKLRLQVITAHKSNYPQPISFVAGEQVQVGKRDTQYPGWIWTTTAAGNSGWAPEQLLDIHGTTAVTRSPYNATELDTAVGEILSVEDLLNSWYLVHNEAGKKGWVPATNLKIVK